jgi:hypothetical protein
MRLEFSAQENFQTSNRSNVHMSCPMASLEVGDRPRQTRDRHEILD